MREMADFDLDVSFRYNESFFVSSQICDTKTVPSRPSIPQVSFIETGLF